MPRYIRQPQPRLSRIRAEEEADDDYAKDRPCVYDLEVEGPKPQDTGIVDVDGVPIMWLPDPIGFLHFED